MSKSITLQVLKTIAKFYSPNITLTWYQLCVNTGAMHGALLCVTWAVNTVVHRVNPRAKLVLAKCVSANIACSKWHKAG